MSINLLDTVERIFILSRICFILQSNFDQIKTDNHPLPQLIILVTYIASVHPALTPVNTLSAVPSVNPFAK